MAKLNKMSWTTVTQPFNCCIVQSALQIYDHDIKSPLCYAKSDKISKVQLFNSNPPIHYQDRYLLFECVKIVELNFNSHVFHVMYQEAPACIKRHVFLIKMHVF